MARMKAYATFDLYLADQTPKNQKLIRALRKFVKRVAPKLEESVKWGNGCWVKGKAPVAYVYSAADYVQLGFFHGRSAVPLHLLSARENEDSAIASRTGGQRKQPLGLGVSTPTTPARHGRLSEESLV